MSQAPLDAKEDPTTSRNRAYREANARQQEMLRNGVSNSGHERNCCYLNTGQGRFANISAPAGLDHIGDGRAYAPVDWDHDGDLDLWATNRTAPRVQFMRNNGAEDHQFLVVRLAGNGTTTNRDAIGARLELFLADGTCLIRTLRAGEGFLSQSSKWLHFGLGKGQDIDRLIVRWPGGKPEEFRQLQVNGHYLIDQGGEARRWNRPTSAGILLPDETFHEPTATAARIPLRYRIPMPTMHYLSVDDRRQPIRKSRSRPVLVNLWASWCAPCMEELADLQAHRDAWQAKGLDLVALSVDSLAEDKSADPDAARQILQKLDIPAGLATSDLIGQFEAALYYLFDFRRPWSVPASFLLDGQGYLAVIYVGPVTAEQILQDVDHLSQDDSAWLDQSLPLPGRWSGEPRHPNLASLIGTFLDRGFTDDASQFVEQYEGLLKADPSFPSLLIRVARLLQSADKNRKAIDHYRSAFTLAPGRADIGYSYAALLAKSGERGAAITVLRKGHELSPENVAILNGLAWFLATGEGASEEMADEALQLAERAAELTGHRQPQILDTLAAAQAAAGQYDLALATIGRAIEIASQSGAAPLANELRSRQQEYRQRRPYREPSVDRSR